MNSLVSLNLARIKHYIITLCVLIEATVIIANTTKRLSSTIPPTTTNKLKKLAFLPPSPSPPRSKKYLYNYNYNTDTGIQVQEEGNLNNEGTDQEALEVQGSYNFTDNEGNTFQVSYVANENGFQPEGAHLPTIPPLIRKALEYIKYEEFSFIPEEIPFEDKKK
ncbi:endocuticle structural glycoprotein SgAbd-2 isoform X1 [Camponotus floridanus]|uniref:endocuticle structural glycoprotein SgAbd-2 isoform X1 n=1 Tax=Camponotus floridanus TaxID=104421 RepID=UPI000DC6AB85|nr:endocuticle structural glycoprotein SgAbd-2 isoform X1 [Camponotus floridanus]